DGSVKSRNWDFGDGQSGSGEVVTHQYAAIGSYTVTLTVTDNDNATSTSSKSVQVENGKAPIARFTVTPAEGDTPINYTFNGSNSSDPDGTVKSYDWDFGDGKSASGTIVTHKFTDANTFGVTLTVTDNSGLQGSVLKDLKVTQFDEGEAAQEI